MLAAFNTTEVDLSAFGYPDNFTFTDPLAVIWRAQAFSGFTDLDEIQNTLLPMMQALNAYPSEDAATLSGVEGFEDALAEFYATHDAPVDPKPTSPLLIPDVANGEGAYKRSVVNEKGEIFEVPSKRAPAAVAAPEPIKAPRRGLIPE